MVLDVCPDHVRLTGRTHSTGFIRAQHYDIRTVFHPCLAGESILRDRHH